MWRNRTIPLVLGLTAALATVVVPTAGAANATATATVTGGSLSLSTAAAPSVSATLNGTDQAPTYTMALNANDDTGTGTGWNITITSTTFTTGGGSPHLLSITASSVTGVTSACATGTCTNPTNAISYPVAVPAAASAPAAVKLFNAAANSGMGHFTVTPTVSVSLPANTFAGTYTSTVTVAAVSGP